MPARDQRPSRREHRLSTLMMGAAVAIFVMALAGVLFVASGVYDIAAATPHWSVTRWVMEQTRNRSIAMHAAGIKVPPGLDDPQKVLMGTEHFAAHCASCHGAPGVPRGEAAEGLYPQPPDLAHAHAHYTQAELFWIVRNGIKMTGMPAWSDHSDEELWATVAFIEKLQGMTEEDYGKLVMQSMQMGGRHMYDGMAMPSGASMPANMPGMDMKNMPMPGQAAPAATGNDHHQ
jgi:mono/diheme cytochrome c family protein